MYVNEDIKKTERVFPMQGRRNYLRYDMNENPEGLPESFVKEVLQEITPEFLATYPEPDRFTNKYAAYLGVKPEQVVATNGSDMAIRYLLEVFGEKGKDVVTVAPSFEMYWVNCRILGLHHVPVSYRQDLTLDINAILKAITGNTRVVVLLNPNNPIGNAYSIGDAERIVEAASAAGALVIVDEAYHYFYRESLAELVERHDNVAVLRTFSKLLSIPACRLGVVISSPEIIHFVKNAKLTFDVNSIALLFGERILDFPEMIQNLMESAQKGKEYTVQWLERNGYTFHKCEGNYILIRTKNTAKDVADVLEKEKKILVHAYGHELLKDYIRVTIGSERVMKIFFDAFSKVDG